MVILAHSGRSSSRPLKQNHFNARATASRISFHTETVWTFKAGLRLSLAANARARSDATYKFPAINDDTFSDWRHNYRKEQKCLDHASSCALQAEAQMRHM